MKRMDKFYNETYLKLETAIQELEIETDCPIKRIEAVIHHIIQSLADLKDFVLKNDFKNMEEEIRRANDLNGQLSLLKRKELQRIQSQSGSIRVSMVYLTMVQEAQNVVTYTINLMKVSRKFQMETEMP